MILPEDIEAEASLLATLSGPGMDQEARKLLPKLREADFVHPRHKALFLALLDVLDDPDGEVNVHSLRAALEDRGLLGRVGGFDGLVQVLAAGEVGRPWKLAERVTELRHRRELIALGAKLQRMAADESPDLVIAEAQSDLTAIAVDGAKVVPTGWGSIRERAVAKLAFRSGDRSRAGRFGLPALDEQAPIPAGQVTILGARPGIGKTALLCQVAALSAAAGATPLVVSLELSQPAMEARLASFVTGRSTWAFKEGQYGEEEVGAITRAAWLDRGAILSLRQGTPWPKIEAAIRADVQRRGCDLVLLDYLSLVGRPPVGKGSSEAYAFAAVSEGITAITKELDLGFVLAAQLTKAEDGTEPRLGGFADSDRPARDAGLVVLLWNDADGHTFAKVAKNRDGRLGYRRRLQFDGASQRFSEMPEALAVPRQKVGRLGA